MRTYIISLLAEAVELTLQDYYIDPDYYPEHSMKYFCTLLSTW